MKPSPLERVVAGDTWIPLASGLSFRPLAFGPGPWRRLLLRLEPGTVIAPHRHEGEVHAVNLQGWRAIAGRADPIGPGTYVHEPVGNVDTWWAVGDEPCVVAIALWGRLEHLDDAGRVTGFDDTASLHASYLAWCAATDVTPDPTLVVAA